MLQLVVGFPDSAAVAAAHESMSVTGHSLNPCNWAGAKSCQCFDAQLRFQPINNTSFPEAVAKLEAAVEVFNKEPLLQS